MGWAARAQLDNDKLGGLLTVAVKPDDSVGSGNGKARWGGQPVVWQALVLPLVVGVVIVALVLAHRKRTKARCRAGLVR